jgi:hypothetical protein
MTRSTARALSTALIGGIATALLLSQGLLLWAALIAWAAFLEAGGDGAAMKKTIVGTLFGAVLGWVALLLMLYVVIPEGTWLWMPRTGFAVAVTLLVLVLATRFEAFASLSLSLYGYAAVLATSAMVIEGLTGPQRLTGLHLYNPLLLTILSMIAGSVLGLISVKLAEAMAKE